VIALAASFPVAWVIALVSVVAPAGLGVREGVLATVLAGARRDRGLLRGMVAGGEAAWT